MFCFTNLIWAQSRSCDEHILQLFLMTTIFWVLLKYYYNKNNNYLFLFSFLYGLSVVAHQTSLILAPVFVIWIFLILINNEPDKSINWFPLIFKMFFLFLLGLLYIFTCLSVPYRILL